MELFGTMGIKFAHEWFLLIFIDGGNLFYGVLVPLLFDNSVDKLISEMKPDCFVFVAQEFALHSQYLDAVQRLHVECHLVALFHTVIELISLYQLNVVAQAPIVVFYSFIRSFEIDRGVEFDDYRNTNASSWFNASLHGLVQFCRVHYFATFAKYIAKCMVSKQFDILFLWSALSIESIFFSNKYCCLLATSLFVYIDAAAFRARWGVFAAWTFRWFGLPFGG